MSCSAISRTRSRPTPRRRRAPASSRWRRRTISARPGCGRASTRSTRPGCSTTSSRSSARSASKLDVIMLPKVEGPWDIHYLDQLLAQLEARHRVSKPILIHAILETAEGVDNVAAIATRLAAHAWHQPRPGRSRRLARDEDHAGRRRASRLQGARRCDARAAAPRAAFQQDLWHYTLAQDGGCLRGRRHQAVLRPVRRFRRSAGLRGAVPQRLPDGLRRRLDAASVADRRSPSACSRPIRPRSRSPRRSSPRCPTAPARS